MATPAATTPNSTNSKNNSSSRRIKQGGFFSNTLPFWLLLPTLLVMGAIQFYPGFYSIWLAFQDKQAGINKYVGLRNFERILDSAEFKASIGHTVVFLVGYIVFTMTVSFCVALLLNRKMKLSGVYLTLLFIPWVIADIIAGLVWGLLIVPGYGTFSPFLSNTTLFPPNGISIGSDPPPPQLISGFPFPPAPAMIYLIIASAWRALPFITLLILAALQTVPREVVESARIDGANGRQALRFITLPLILPTLIIAMFNLVLGGVNGVGMVFSLTRGGPGTATEVMGYLLYQIGFGRLEFGRAAALSVFMAVVNLILITGILRISRTQTQEQIA